MSDNKITLYFLVKDNKVVFGPRKYHKPAFDKFILNNEINVSLPDESDIKDINLLEDGYSLVSEESYQPIQLDLELEEKVIEEEPKPIKKHIRKRY